MQSRLFYVFDTKWATVEMNDPHSGFERDVGARGHVTCRLSGDFQNHVDGLRVFGRGDHTRDHWHAGADPYKEDQLGGLSLTIDGLKKRDELVFRVARARDIPVMVTFAGGYALNVEDRVTIHCNTVVAAKGVFVS